MKKLLLSEDTDYQVSLAGIISPLPFYRLAYLINSELEFNFSLDEDWIAEVQDKKTSAIKSEHVYYSYYDEMLEMAWSIIKNRGTEDFILKTNPVCDYFLMAKGEDPSGAFESCCGKISALSGDATIIPINFEAVKNKEKFFKPVKQ